MIKVILFILLCCSSSLLGAEENNSTVHPLIKEFDKDKDGKIFYTEASKALQDDFCQYDVNQDAYIDSVEVEAIK
jgi:Ca2+-binding EF-hand superfamily protein